MNSYVRVEGLSDEELLRRTGELAARGRRIEAALITHMAEVDHRKLYRGEACSSMFAYATRRLRLSESQAYDRITVARTSRKFPLVLEMLADGRLTLTAASKLGPHLSAENATDLLARAVHATRRQVEVLVAELTPQPDMPSSLRRLPAPRQPASVADVRPAAESQPTGGGIGADTVAKVRPAGPAAPPAKVVAISPARFRVQFTASAELEEKIQRARALPPCGSGTRVGARSSIDKVGGARRATGSRSTTTSRSGAAVRPGSRICNSSADRTTSSRPRSITGRNSCRRSEGRREGCQSAGAGHSANR